MRYKGRFSYLLICSHTILFILLHVELYTLYIITCISFFLLKGL